MVTYNKKAHEAYAQYLIGLFWDAYNCRLNTHEAEALATVHYKMSKDPSVKSPSLGSSYQDFVDEFEKKESLEPHLTLMRADLFEEKMAVRSGPFDSMYVDGFNHGIETATEILVERGWRRTSLPVQSARKGSQ
jgi:hypothetical protein